MLLHVEDAVEALPAVVAAEGLFAGVLSNIVSSQIEHCWREIGMSEFWKKIQDKIWEIMR